MEKLPEQWFSLAVDGLNLTSCFLTCKFSRFRSDLHCDCLKVIKYCQSSQAFQRTPGDAQEAHLTVPCDCFLAAAL